MKLPIFALLVAVASPGLSQSAPAPAASAPSKPDPAAVTAALKYLEVEHFEQQLLESTEMFTDAFMAAAIQRQQEKDADEQAPDAFMQELRSVVREHSLSTMKANIGDLRQQTAELYARHLTAAELTRIAELSSDPAMQKMREREKLIQPQLVVMGMQLMKKYEPALKAKVDAVVKKHLEALDGGNSES